MKGLFLFPSKIRQNDTLAFTTKLDAKYNDWTLTYFLTDQYSAVGAFNANDGLFHINETSTDWKAGSYAVQGVVTKGSERFTVETCTTQILPDISKLTDSSSHIKKVLDAVEATILGAASKEQESYEVAGRSLKYRSLDELLKLRELYKREYASELQACAIANGEGFSRTIKVRF